MWDKFAGLHKSINFIRTLRKAPQQGATDGAETGAVDSSGVLDAKDETSLVDVWKYWKQESCDKCMGVPISDLMSRNDFQIESRIGCLETNDGVPIPECPGTSAADQAAGHAGSFRKLRNGLIAKRSMALDVPRSKRSFASLASWNFYMQTWCMSKLARNGSHVLRPFALGTTLDTNPWAPRFYGLCQTSEDTGDSNKYLIMEDMEGKFRMPSRLDIKLGQTIEPVKPKNHVEQAKHMFQNALAQATPTHSEGARLAGYKVWNPHKQEWRQSNALRTSLTDVFDEAFKYLLKQGGERKKRWLTQLRNRVEDLHRWWKEFGIYHVRCYAASLLFVWEGKPTAEAPPDPVVKLIDFAHFHAHSDHPEWPDDDTSKGLGSVVKQLERLIDLAEEAAPGLQ